MMFFPGEPKDVAERLVREWLQDPAASVDPLQSLAAFCRAGAEYHARLHDKRVEATCEYLADLLDAVIRTIRETNVDYDCGAELSLLARSTIKSRKKDFGPAPRGQVPLAGLPLKGTAANAGLHADRILQLAAEQRMRAQTTDGEHAKDADEDEKWVSKRIRDMTA